MPQTSRPANYWNGMGPLTIGCIVLLSLGCERTPSATTLPIAEKITPARNEVSSVDNKRATESPAVSKASPTEDQQDKASVPETKAEAAPQAEPAESDLLANQSPFPKRIEIPELPKDLEWLNTAPLSMKQLRGKFVIFDFWTYCCINCMHILPELKKLEHEFAEELVVIGVHSAKFEEERDLDNIRSAIQRYEIDHPVINDAQHKLWNMFDINSWPTILMIDPEGHAVWGRSGEFKAAEVAKVLKRAIPYYKRNKSLVTTPIKFAPEAAKLPATPLRFPGKVLADEASNRLFIADSNHNRIVVATLDGQLLDVVGSGEIGAKDGDFKTATFNHPQGMALLEETLYVCDTENHMLRKVDLKEQKVRTIAGNGEQAASGFPGFEGFSRIEKPRERWVGKPKTTELNSPWDCYIHEKQLFIAMAGPHQIWRMPLDESEIGPYAGNGREDIVDGALLPRVPYQEGFSSFAQPSGLTSDGKSLFVADSEGSSVRAVPLDGRGEVTTVVGTSDLPQGRLFYFGDVDGTRDRVKLQHCLGVAYHEGNIFIADTYNNKIKWCDAKTGGTSTIAGTGEPGKQDSPAQFDEPAGISFAAGKLFVADTNNHLIRVVDVKSKAVSTLKIGGLNPPVKQQKPDAKPDFSAAPVVKLPAQTLQAKEGKLQFNVNITLPEGWKMNPLGKPAYFVDSSQPSGPATRGSFGRVKLTEPALSWTVTVPVTGEGTDVIRISTNYYMCQKKDEGVCKIKDVVFEIPVTITASGSATPVALEYTSPE